jgi:hypothetical protein
VLAGRENFVAGQRQNYIPVRKPAILAALTQSLRGKTDAVEFARLAALVSALIHHRYFDELERLRDGHALHKDGGGGDESYAAFEKDVDLLMRQANFEEIPPEELDVCDRETKDAPVRTHAPKWHYATVKFYRRGLHETLERQARTWPMAAKERTIDTYDDVVVLVRFRKSGGKRRQRALPGGVKPGSLLIKSFVNMPVRDLCMLYPDLRIRMTRADALLLGAPALLGGIPILLSLSSALGVILIVLGALLGFGGTVDDNQMMQAIGALTALAGAGAFLFRQYSNYAFKKLKYQKRIADSIYYRNVANNAGVFETLIGAAEDQDAKEALLAYAFLLRDGATTRENLDARIEAWLRETFAEDIDFQIGDALEKLAAMDLVTREGPYLTARSLDQALRSLDAQWDRLYDSHGVAHPAAAPSTA